jgi:hypothetical protein
MRIVSIASVGLGLASTIYVGFLVVSSLERVTADELGGLGWTLLFAILGLAFLALQVAILLQWRGVRNGKGPDPFTRAGFGGSSRPRAR